MDGNAAENASTPAKPYSNELDVIFKRVHCLACAGGDAATMRWHNAVESEGLEATQGRDISREWTWPPRTLFAPGLK
jgi:hypothetical protein